MASHLLQSAAGAAARERAKAFTLLLIHRGAGGDQSASVRPTCAGAKSAVCVDHLSGNTSLSWLRALATRVPYSLAPQTRVAAGCDDENSKKVSTVARDVGCN